MSRANTTGIKDVEPWMFKIARERPGMYTIKIFIPSVHCCSFDTVKAEPVMKKILLCGSVLLLVCPVVRLMTSLRGFFYFLAAVNVLGFIYVYFMCPETSGETLEVNFTGEEFAKLDKVIMNQIYAESKSKVQSAIVFQHATVIWPSHTPDDVTMRTLGSWAITEYRCNGTWMKNFSKCFSYLPCCAQKQVRLCLKQGTGSATPSKDDDPPKAVWLGPTPKPAPPVDLSSDTGVPVDKRYVRTQDVSQIERHAHKCCECGCTYEHGHPGGHGKHGQCLGNCPEPTCPRHDPGTDYAGAQKLQPTPPNEEPKTTESKPPRNDLGYIEPGHGNEDLHPLGGTSAEDTEIRAERQDRIVENVAGVGVVGQSTNSSNTKQIVGVVSLPVTDTPNVYAREAANVQSAIDNRITKKQRPFTANKEDKALLGRLVYAAIGDHPRRSLFSARRVTAWWETHLFADLKSGKWTEDRLSRTIENLCGRIEPGFKLACDVKLEPMPEGKAPRMLIADGDEGQVLALLTVCCIEDSIKKHLPKKTIKGLGKRAAMERVAAELRAPKAAYSNTKTQSTQRTGCSKMLKPGVSIFEGDGSAWDTTCSIQLRDCVENPVILHVGSILKVFMAQPMSWIQAHDDVSVLDKLTITFKKNGEFRKHIIDAIRRSGHRGTSCLNWWVNFTCWHCAIFEEPEKFLDPDVRYGRDHAGTYRWIASAFEGDDSILSTTPRIEEKDELYVSLMQRWERFGFNMKIFIRAKRALFTGYHMALDNDGPTGVLMPEVDRCFARAGISCSPSMIEYFKKEDRAGCQSVSRAAALSRAHEFAGCAPTISTKYLRYYESLAVKTNVDRDLQMRTCGGDVEFSEPDIVAEINLKNGAAMTFDSAERDRLAAVGFECTEEELSRFSLRVWDYDVLKDWEGFRESLPKSWRMA